MEPPTLNLAGVLDALVQGLLEAIVRNHNESSSLLFGPALDLQYLARRMRRIDHLLTEAQYLAGASGLLALNTALEAARTGAACRYIMLAAGAVQQLSVTLTQYHRELLDQIQQVQLIIAHRDDSKDIATLRDTVDEYAQLSVSGEFDDCLPIALKAIASANQQLASKVSGAAMQLQAGDISARLDTHDADTVTALCAHIHGLSGEIAALGANLGGAGLQAILAHFRNSSPRAACLSAGQMQ